MKRNVKELTHYVESNSKAFQDKDNAEHENKVTVVFSYDDK